MSKWKFDKYEIDEITECIFETILEEPEFRLDVRYEDLSSAMQKDYLTEVQERLDFYFKEELENIMKNWSDKDTNIKRLENENKRLRQQLADANKTWSEDMGF